jgi:carotenoid cleavage dioxygenase-like enzyme
MLNYAALLGPRNEYRFFSVGPQATEPELIARIPVREPGYVHSFALTQRWIVLAEFPWVVNPLRLVLSGRPFAENFRWKPERGTRFLLVDRATGEPGPVLETPDPFFAFHHLNAFDDGDGLVLDIAVYPDASLVEELYLDRLRSGHAPQMGRLRRFRLDPARGTVEHQELVDAPFELGRINYGAVNERPYRYAWGVTGDGSDWIDALIRLDLHERTTTVWREAGTYPGEPVFVARPGATAEDDGVLLSVVLDAAEQTSFLLVLDAADLREIARAQAPHHIPVSVHGMFSRG